MANGTMTNPATSHDEEMIKIEREKLALEERKFEEEKQKKIWTAISTAAPLVTLVGTVAWGVYSLNETARRQFELEAAKTIMSATTPKESLDRLTMFKSMFPEKIPWKLDLDIPDSTKIRAQMELFRAMSARDSDPSRALDVWIALFGDDWAESPALRTAAQKPPQPK
jgi:hypothetical protein